MVHLERILTRLREAGRVPRWEFRGDVLTGVYVLFVDGAEVWAGIDRAEAWPAVRSALAGHE